jgi:hypothetical protein
MNEHKNGITKQYRYKKFNEKTQKYIGKHFFPQPFGFCYHQSTNGVKYVFVKHDYRPYWFFKILWSLYNWYKRPKLKAIKIHPIVSKLIEYWVLLIITIIAGIILILIERGIIDIGI